jgi:hypothetical protein
LKDVWDFNQGAINFSAVDKTIIFTRIVRDDPVASFVKHFHYTVTGAVGFRAGAHHGDRFDAVKNIHD